MTRPDFIRHWQAHERAEDPYDGDTEPLAVSAPLGRLTGLTRIGIHHVRLAPGRRTSYPHAESAEEEFVYVLEGTPDVWIDGNLHRLAPGDAVGFPAGTGICHCFLNNSREDVRLLVIGEATKPENKVRYPLNEAYAAARPELWRDWPARPLGPHDGKAKAPG
jgi:uncharacterized cupin superfamily protein